METQVKVEAAAVQGPPPIPILQYSEPTKLELFEDYPDQRISKFLYVLKTKTNVEFLPTPNSLNIVCDCRKEIILTFDQEKYSIWYKLLGHFCDQYTTRNRSHKWNAGWNIRESTAGQFKVFGKPWARIDKPIKSKISKI